VVRSRDEHMPANSKNRKLLRTLRVLRWRLMRWLLERKPPVERFRLTPKKLFDAYPYEPIGQFPDRLADWDDPWNLYDPFLALLVHRLQGCDEDPDACALELASLIESIEGVAKRLGLHEQVRRKLAEMRSEKAPEYAAEA